jgi:acetyltransferase
MNKSLDAIFRPRSVAVVGASAKKGGIGREVFDKLLESDFNGPAYPVNPTANFVHSVKAYPSVTDLPEPVDLAVIVVPQRVVLSVVEECARKGVKGIVVISAGFKEIGGEGTKLERRMVELIKQHGMRLVGPNCMGIINTEPAVRLDATFAPTIPKRGNVAFVSQSGALGVTVLEFANNLNLGVSMFASVGNKADISGNDLLEYWKDDSSIDVILMYLESFGNPRKFTRLAREVSQKKPIIVVKSGRTASGARAASSHTGALAGMDMAFDALFKQCGVIRAETIEVMFDISMALANQPIPKGNRVAVVTNAGGPGIMAADACESLNLEMIELSEETQRKLRDYLPPEASVRNPVDLIASGDEETFQYALDQVLQDEKVDSAIVIFVPPIFTDPTKVARRISEVAHRFDKPVLGCFMGTKGVAGGVEELKRHQIPAYLFPESAAEALSAMVSYGRWKQEERGKVVEYEVNRVAVTEVLNRCKQDERQHLSDLEVLQVMEAYGIPFARSVVGCSLDEVKEGAAGMGYPVVLKVMSKDIIHKSDIGGVVVDIRSEDELEKAYKKMGSGINKRGIATDELCFAVQEMISGGRETILGLNSVPNFGHLVMFGLGGVYVEALKDVCFRISPLTDRDAAEMVEGIRGYPILKGIRGEKSVAFERITETLMRLSQLAHDFPEILELDINPFITFPEPERCKSVDARIRISLEPERTRFIQKF